MRPVEGLEDQRHGRWTSAPKDDRIDGHTVGILPTWIDVRALLGRCGEARIRMRSESPAIGCPVLTRPVDQMLWCWR